MQCLHSVRNQLLSSAAVIENWHSLIYRARLYLRCEKQFLADMLIDPDFYCPRNQNRLSGRISSSQNGARILDLRAIIFPNATVIRHAAANAGGTTNSSYIPTILVGT
ncbi:unnamed protein product [Echinostoma caproni]|uniref:DDE_Tnp_Tn3 domain-containing protein n=1 Tax=Echinostoma caproni TaxID=27848 RepID=A0A183ALQ2_9TREM|nr:unnamed protein product [Echinostoma caproni]